MIRRTVVVLAATLMLVGCRFVYEPIEEVSFDSPEQAKQILIERRDAVRSVQAEADIRITSPGPDASVQNFDGALVMDGPKQVRLRTWKLTQTLFDLTVNDDGTWIAVSDELTKRRPAAEQDLGRLADRLGLLMRGPDYAQATLVPGDDGQTLLARWPEGTARIDRNTLTPTRFTFDDDRSGETVMIETQFAEYDGGVWYHRVSLSGGFGQLDMRFRNVQLNGELNPRAFRPPRRAVRP
jgi:hypothetical protein